MQEIAILRHIDQNRLFTILRDLIDIDCEICVVTPLREFAHPDPNAISIKDWLVIYKSQDCGIPKILSNQD